MTFRSPSCTARRAVLLGGLLACATAALTGCHDPLGVGALGEAFGGNLVEVDVYPSATRDGARDTLFAVGDTVFVTAGGRVGGLAGLWAYDPLRDAAWRLSDSALGTLAVVPATPGDSAPVARARVVARAAGALTITASARGKSGSVTVAIRTR